MRQDRVNLTRKCFRLHKCPKQPQNGHNLFLAVHFDIYLAIESKITPKWSKFLMQLALVWWCSKLTFFKAKQIKTLNFELQKSYIPQKKAKNMYNKDLERKNENFCKKDFFFFFFFNFLDMLEDPEKFRCSIFQKFCKRNFKNGFSGISQKVTETKSPILVILAPLWAKLQT